MIKTALAALTFFLGLTVAPHSQAKTATAQLDGAEALQMIDLLGEQNLNKPHDVLLTAYVSEQRDPSFIYRVAVDGEASGNAAVTQQNLEHWFELTEASGFEVQYDYEGSTSKKVHMQVQCDLPKQHCEFTDLPVQNLSGQITVLRSPANNRCEFRVNERCHAGEITASCIAPGGHYGVGGCTCCPSGN
jgi:hypothetical protein